MMGLEAEDKPGGGKVFIGAKRLQHGCILYLTTSDDAAKWLRQTTVRESFLRNYSSFASMRNRGRGVIVKYIPIGYDPISSNANQTMEREMGWRLEKST